MGRGFKSHLGHHCLDTDRKIYHKREGTLSHSNTNVSQKTKILFRHDNNRESVSLGWHLFNSILPHLGHTPVLFSWKNDCESSCRFYTPSNAYYHRSYFAVIVGSIPSAGSSIPFGIRQLPSLTLPEEFHLLRKNSSQIIIKCYTGAWCNG